MDLGEGITKNNSLLLRNATIYTPFETIRHGYIVIHNGFIKEIGYEPYTGNKTGFEEINLENMIVGPGLIDTHIHGLHGYDTMDSSKESFMQMSKILPRYGVTAFIPSTVTGPHEKLLAVSRAFKEAFEEWKPLLGARLIGLHLEGPYINPVKAGAQNKEFIRNPSVKEFDEYYKTAGGAIKEITVAPEIPGALNFIRYVSAKKVVVQIGHTNATYRETINGIIAGASKATHLFNGMRGIHHREPGVVVALMQSKSVYLEIITDFIHVSPEMIKFVIDYAKPDRVMLVTDAISATGLPDGEYELGGLRIVVEKGVSRLVDTGGLAGSTLTMDKALRNIVSLGFSLNTAFEMASITPAKAIGIKEELKIGSVKPGYRADLVILDKNLEVVATIIEGYVVYSKNIL
ncbi:MAG: N-acetylglucosamine-6-phosphate deacetylase [Desulfurococcales archaeon]|nr:N-acetylglucosamine-6-phosphate deacetylase [Desulfurococcales archaeon]